MLRQKWGSVVCPGCSTLVGVQDEQCLNCGRKNPGLWGFAPLLNRFGRNFGFAPLVLGACITLYVITLLADPSGIRMGGLLGMLSPSMDSLIKFGATGRFPVLYLNRWWTLLSASWLHGGILHILFNMMWVRDLAPAVSEFYGPSRMTIIYVLSGVAGFSLSTLLGSTVTIGASASLFGMFGALMYYGRRTGSRHVTETVRHWVIIGFIFGFLMPGIDNWAHLGGFAGGYLTGRFLDPLHHERLDHLIVALVLIGLTILSILASVLL